MSMPSTAARILWADGSCRLLHQCFVQFDTTKRHWSHRQRSLHVYRCRRQYAYLARFAVLK